MIWLKACPRCRGDLFLERELEGIGVRCLQCGAALTRQQLQAVGLSMPPEYGLRLLPPVRLDSATG